MSVFETLNSVNVNEHTEGKNGLTYLSWAWAWAEFKKVYPEATYEVWTDDEGRPYIADDDLGYMVFTSVTVGELTHEMWLPVMDSQNHAMKSKPYKVYTKYGKEIPVAQATMFDVNKTLMRCLTKNLAMFGLGLYIYAGEDLPEDASTADSNKSTERVLPKTREEAWSMLMTECNNHGVVMQKVCEKYDVSKESPFEDIMNVLQKVWDKYGA